MHARAQTRGGRCLCTALERNDVITYFEEIIRDDLPVPSRCFSVFLCGVDVRFMSGSFNLYNTCSL